MLSVTPPMHKDFRGRAPLSHPGEGWRAYVPPPLPTVQPAFHFLSSLLEQAVVMPNSLAKKVRPPMSATLYGRLEKMMNLPMEVLDLIAEYVVEGGSGASLASTSRFFHCLATRHLYADVELASHASVIQFCQTLEEDTHLKEHVRSLSILCHRPQWSQMHRLTVALGKEAQSICQLRIRFPASDLQEAMPFLSAFSPISFEWITSPCWMMRPAHLFSQICGDWTRLRHITFGNFRFDHALVESIAAVPSLCTLTLIGNGTIHLDHQTLLTLLMMGDGVHTAARHPLSIHIFDCPVSTRIRLDGELQSSSESASTFIQNKIVWS